MNPVLSSMQQYGHTDRDAKNIAGQQRVEDSRLANISQTEALEASNVQQIHRGKLGKLRAFPEDMLSRETE